MTKRCEMEEMNMKNKVAVIRGGGIGPEITEATVDVMEATGLSFDWEDVLVGGEAEEKYGHPLPQESVQKIREIGLAVKAPLIVDKMKGRLVCVHEDGSEHIYPSLNNAVRRELDLFVDPRPIRGVPGISGKYADLDVHIMREITQDVYAGIEHTIGDYAAECTKLCTRDAVTKLTEFAFDYAIKNGRKKVSCVHKANAISLTDGLFLKTFREVAKKYPQVESDDYMVDATAFFLAKDPSKFDVIVTSNQYGDILSDLAAGLAGSLGLAPGANIGDGICVAEASHGAAPDIAGKGIVNPVALILSGALLLRYMGCQKEAEAIEVSTREILAAGQCLTADLGGKATTKELTGEIVAAVKHYLK